MATLTNVTVNDTGFVKLPSGTTAQRPDSPVTGMVRYNTDLNTNEYYNGTNWLPLTYLNQVQATGGSVTTAGGYRIHTYTGDDTFNVANVPGLANQFVDVLVIGGGGGGTNIGGGGGAGGAIFATGLPVATGSNIPVAIGGGGGGANNHSGSNNGAGGSSRFNNPNLPITAVGGGRGAPYPAGPSGSAYSGGSGGGGPGGGGPSRPARYYDGGNGTTGQGFPGGWGCHNNSPGAHYGGGGGGGAGTGGYSIAEQVQARGGEGMATNISGSVVYRAGGGAGGMHNPDRDTNSMGGRGGGGDTVKGNSGSQGQDGTGSGGGGGFYNPSPDRGGRGGNGVVIVRYRYDT